MSYIKTVTDNSFKIVCTGALCYDTVSSPGAIYMWRIDFDDYDQLVRTIIREFDNYGLTGSNNNLNIKHYTDDVSLYFQANGPKGRKFIKYLKEKGIL